MTRRGLGLERDNLKEGLSEGMTARNYALWEDLQMRRRVRTNRAHRHRQCKSRVIIASRQIDSRDNLFDVYTQQWRKNKPREGI